MSMYDIGYAYGMEKIAKAKNKPIPLVQRQLSFLGFRGKPQPGVMVDGKFYKVHPKAAKAIALSMEKGPQEGTMISLDAFYDELEKIAWSVGEQTIGPEGGLKYHETTNNWTLGPQFKKSGPQGTWTREPDFYFALPEHIKKKVKFKTDEEVSTAEVEIPLKDVKDISKKHPEMLVDLKNAVSNEAQRRIEEGAPVGGALGFLSGGVAGTAAGALLGAKTDHPIVGGIAGGLVGGALGSGVGTLLGIPAGSAVGAVRAAALRKKVMKKFPELAMVKEEDYW